MLSKKISIQKSFRIEANMEKDLELLSEKLNRPQNELVNAALNQLMIDNMGWFAEDYLLDLCKNFLEGSVSEIEIKITGLRLSLKDTGETIAFNYDINTKNFSEHCKNSVIVSGEIGRALIKGELKEIALKMGIDSPEIQEYLQNRFDYIYSREKNIHKFDRNKFIRQSIGEEPEDLEYKALTAVRIPFNDKEE